MAPQQLLTDKELGWWRYAPRWFCRLFSQHPALPLYAALLRTPRMLVLYVRSRVVRRWVKQAVAEAIQTANALSTEEKVADIKRWVRNGGS